MTINPIFYQVYTYSYLSQSAVQTNETWEANSATKKLKKCMKHNIGISRGVGGLKKKIPSVGEVWIFSGITQYKKYL